MKIRYLFAFWLVIVTVLAACSAEPASGINTVGPPPSTPPIACEIGFERCAGVCVNLLEDTNNCYACGNKCAVPAGASTVTCTQNGCTTVCGAGFKECPTGCCRNRAALRISAGRDFSCALLSDGTVGCWGDNKYGQLARELNATTKDVAGIKNAKFIESGPFHSCALIADGSVWCWGDNSVGQLGQGSRTQSGTPQTVIGLSEAITEVALGDSFSCALGQSGAVYCWGANTHGQLGDGAGGLGKYSFTPVRVSTLSGVRHIGVGYNKACAVKADGTVACWGQKRRALSVDQDQLVPVSVSGPNGVTALDGGESHMCARATDSVYCWGASPFGQVGIASSYSDEPAMVQNSPSMVESLHCARATTCTRSTDSNVFCWGTGNNGVRAGATEDRVFAPTPATLLGTMAKQITLGGDHGCIIGNSGEVRCFGTNNYGQADERRATMSQLGLGQAIEFP
jgi:alpha-tubulin suppressor-like RCC1 family protein